MVWLRIGLINGAVGLRSWRVKGVFLLRSRGEGREMVGEGRTGWMGFGLFTFGKKGCVGGRDRGRCPRGGASVEGKFRGRSLNGVFWLGGGGGGGL